MFPAHLRLVEFVPGQTLTLRRSGFSWTWMPRAGCTIFLLPFVVIPIGLLAGMIYDKGIPTATLEFSAILVLIPVFLVFWYGLLYLFVTSASTLFTEWTFIDVRGNQGELVLRSTGKLFWLSDRRSIPLNNVTSLSVSVRERKGRDVYLLVGVEYRASHHTRETLKVHFRVEDLDMTKEALALSFAFANLIGLEHYRIDRSDHLETELVLSRNGDGNQWKTVPTVDAKLNFEADLQPDRTGEAIFDDVETPELDLDEFKPELYHRELTHLSEPWFDWETPDRKRIYTPSIHWGYVIFLSLFSGGTAGIVLTVFFGGLIQYGLEFFVHLQPSVYFIAGGLGLIVALMLGVYLRYRFREREVVFDIDERTMQLREGVRRKQYDFADIRELVLIGLRDRNDDQADDYNCELVASTPDGRRTLLISGKSHDRDIVYKIMGSLTDELSNATDTPWKWKGFQRGGSYFFGLT